VASAIMIASIGVLLQLFASGLDRMHRSGIVAHRVLLERQIVSELKSINPARKSSGKGSAEGWGYRWQAEKIVEFRPMQVSGQVSNQQAALFNVHVDLIRDRKTERSFELYLFGWQ